MPKSKSDYVAAAAGSLINICSLARTVAGQKPKFAHVVSNIDVISGILRCTPGIIIEYIVPPINDSEENIRSKDLEHFESREFRANIKSYAESIISPMGDSSASAMSEAQTLIDVMFKSLFELIRTMDEERRTRMWSLLQELVNSTKHIDC